MDSETPVESETLIGGPAEEVGPSTGKLVAVPSVKVPNVDDALVLEDEMLVHQITPSSLSMHEVMATDFVLVVDDTGGVTVITI